jgi:hypothetical protein
MCHDAFLRVKSAPLSEVDPPLPGMERQSKGKFCFRVSVVKKFHLGKNRSVLISSFLEKVTEIEIEREIEIEIEREREREWEEEEEGRESD